MEKRGNEKAARGRFRLGSDARLQLSYHTSGNSLRTSARFLPLYFPVVDREFRIPAGLRAGLVYGKALYKTPAHHHGDHTAVHADAVIFGNDRLCRRRRICLHTAVLFPEAGIDKASRRLQFAVCCLQDRT